VLGLVVQAAHAPLAVPCAARQALATAAAR
jgi:hypothetical protein